MKKINIEKYTKFGMLTVLEDIDPDPKKYGKYSGRRLIVKCDCGKIKNVNKRAVMRGRVRSCGCLHKKVITKHGLSETKIYAVWRAMIHRCSNPKSTSFFWYGGRGIQVCKEWSNLRSFIDWCLGAGYKKGLTIERKNNDGNYCPDNCVFVSRRDNLNNTSKTVFLSIKGKKIALQNAAIKYGINQSALYQRIHKLGWSHERAVTVPVKGKNDKF